MKRLFKKIHLWLSVPVGLIIVCICFSGASMVFQKDIIQALNPQLYKVESKGTPLSADSLMKVASNSLPDSVQATGMTISVNPERSYQINLTKPWNGALFINQYTGRVLGVKPDYPFFQAMYRLHTALLGQPTHGGEASLGERIVGIVTLLMVFILITGFIVWYPKTLRLLRMRLQVSIRRGWKRFLYDLHVSAGAYALLLLLACALTGLTWSFDWYEKVFYSLFGGIPEEEKAVTKTDAFSSASVQAKTDALSSASVQSGEKKTDAISSVSPQKNTNIRTVDGTTSASEQKHHKNNSSKAVDVETSASPKKTVDATTSASQQKHNDTTVAKSVDATTSASKREEIDATSSASKKNDEVEESEQVDGVTSASQTHKKNVDVKKSTAHRKTVSKKVDGVTSASVRNHKKSAPSKSGVESPQKSRTSENNSRTSVKIMSSKNTVDGVSSASPLKTANEATSYSTAYLQPILNVLQKKVTDYKTITLNVDASANVVTKGGWNNPFAADSYTFDSKNSSITGTHFYKDKPLSRRAEDWVHAVHTGAWGGFVTKIITFIACLIGISLPLTGYYLWLNRFLRKSRRKKSV